MITSEVKIRVRYAETDKMGYVYYGNYAMYYEVARGQLVRDVGLSYVRFEEEGFFLPIAKMEIKYLAPAKYDEVLTVRIKLKRYTSARLEFEYEIFNEQGEKINEGYTLQVFISGKTRKPVRAPEYFIEALKKYEKHQKSK